MSETDRKMELLEKIARRFREVGITWALGASMLLYFKGIAAEFHDIDLLIAESDAEAARTILSGMGEFRPSSPNPKYRTRTFLEFVINGIDVDVMAGFSIVSSGRLYDCSLQKEQIVEWLPLGSERIPLQSVRLWQEYYRRMGRTQKVEMIENAMLNPQISLP